MSIREPNQYQINSMKQGDMIYLNKPSIWYRIYRKLFLNKIKLNIPKYIGSKETISVYQEDCVLMYYYELVCVDHMENTVPMAISKSATSKCKQAFRCKSVTVTLDDCVLELPNGNMLAIPLEPIQQAVARNKIRLDKVDKQNLMDEFLKYHKHTGKYFKTYVEKHNIKTWDASYCSVCGKPIEMIFTDDLVKVNNKCDCKSLILNINQFTYDEFAMWYYTQTDPNVIRRFKKFWFEKEE